ncbi:MAG: glycosyltransferase family 2 protein [Candidatus Omnitrophica bacterium]|nr:glycosyltransferase family 2 protein [Candidatus Omnitrophota bacterium]
MIHVFLPAYNEAHALPILASKFEAALGKERPYRLFIYDDGSRDATRQIAESLKGRHPVEVRFHEHNAGLGQTLIDGFAELVRTVRDEDVVVTLDCDDTHEPSFLIAALQELDRGYDVVILSRFKSGGGQQGLSALKSFLSMGAGLFLKLFFPIRGVREYSCNFRVFRGSIVKKAHEVYGNTFIQLPHLGFVAAPEILIKMRMLGARITEVPFVLKYQQKMSPSANRAWKTISGYFVLVWKYWLRRPAKDRSRA